jgi:hypothetical protein
LNEVKLKIVEHIQDKIKVNLIPLVNDDLLGVERDWITLQANSNCPYYLTWNWIGSWVKQCEAPIYLLKASIDEQVVGLAFIFKKKRRVLGFYPVTQWWLNRTGDDKYDQVWIEYNDLLTKNSSEKEIRACMLLYIAQNNNWDEFILGMTSKKVEDDFYSLSKYKRVVIEDFGYQVNLNKIKDSYLKEVVSRNTRQKINQTCKLLTKQGNLNFSVITSTEVKLNALNQIKKFHVEKWSDTSTPSGFQNIIFSKCIEEQLKSKNTEIAQLTLNTKAIAYLVNYIFKGRVYFYLSALHSDFNGKIKLGLYIHSLTIEFYKAKNMDVYDFLAGESRYKKSLSNSSYSHNLVCFYKNNPLLHIEELFRK